MLQFCYRCNLCVQHRNHVSEGNYDEQSDASESDPSLFLFFAAVDTIFVSPNADTDAEPFRNNWTPKSH